jgi:hypothetical protein
MSDKRRECHARRKQVRAKGSRRRSGLYDRASSAIPALVFTAGAFQKKFKPNEVLSEDTGLGRLVSVALILTIDTGGERFGFFLPFIDVARDQTAHFYTVGIYETFSGPDSVPHRPSTWRCIEMTGTAQSVIVPL